MSYTKNLEVSVIITTKDNENIIQECLESVTRQSYQNMEIIVVDSSRDGTLSIVREYEKISRFPFTIIRQEPRGAGAARNAGIKLAKGDVITFVDADCTVPPDFVEKIVAPFSEDRVICAIVELKYDPTDKCFFSDLVNLYDSILNPQYTTFDMWVAHRKLYQLVGLFNEKLQAGEDNEWRNRAKKMAKIIEIQGYRVAFVRDTYMHEKKSCQRFTEYYKKCMWYGSAFAVPEYLKTSLVENLVKLFFIVYLTALPFLLIFSFALNMSTIFMIFLLAPFVFLSSYTLLMAYKSSKSSWKVFLLPVFLFYRSFWFLIGIIKG